MLTVLSLIRPSLTEQVAAAAPEVRVVPIAGDGDVPADITGEVLLTYPWASPNLHHVLARGVRWIHVVGTGIDAFPLHVLTDQMLTCSRGASAVPIAEWVLAVMLAFEKRLPEAWIHAPPADGWSRGARGTLHGRTPRPGRFRRHRHGGGAACPALRHASAARSAAPPAPSDLAGVEIVALPARAGRRRPTTWSSPRRPRRPPATCSAARSSPQCKPEAHLINMARGALVDQDALRAALDDGQLAMASLDAVEPEPLPEGHWMYTHPRVRLSPHVSWQMPGAIEVLIDSFVDNLRRYRAGEPLDRYRRSRRRLLT